MWRKGDWQRRVRPETPNWYGARRKVREAHYSTGVGGLTAVDRWLWAINFFGFIGCGLLAWYTTPHAWWLYGGIVLAQGAYLAWRRRRRWAHLVPPQQNEPD